MLHLQTHIGSYWFFLVAIPIFAVHASCRQAMTRKMDQRSMGEAANDWLSATRSGFHAAAASDSETAARHWLAAHDALRMATPDDPLRAAAETNAGAAHVLLRQRGRAERSLAEAERLWLRILEAIAVADIPISGRSSAFHFRLASQSLEAFRDAQRQRLARLSTAGLEMTRFNRHLARAAPSADTMAAAALASELAKLLGPHSPEVRLLAERHAASSHYADKIAAFDANRAPMSEVPSDGWPRLEVAVALTVLLAPGTGPDVRRGRQELSAAFPIKPSSTR